MMRVAVWLLVATALLGCSMALAKPAEPGSIDLVAAQGREQKSAYPPKPDMGNAWPQYPSEKAPPLPPFPDEAPKKPPTPDAWPRYPSKEAPPLPPFPGQASHELPASASKSEYAHLEAQPGFAGPSADLPPVDKALAAADEALDDMGSSPKAAKVAAHAETAEKPADAASAVPAADALSLDVPKEAMASKKAAVPTRQVAEHAEMALADGGGAEDNQDDNKEGVRIPETKTPYPPIAMTLGSGSADSKPAIPVEMAPSHDLLVPPPPQPPGPLPPPPRDSYESAFGTVDLSIHSRFPPPPASYPAPPSSSPFNFDGKKHEDQNVASSGPATLPGVQGMPQGMPQGGMPASGGPPQGMSPEAMANMMSHAEATPRSDKSPATDDSVPPNVGAPPLTPQAAMAVSGKTGGSLNFPGMPSLMAQGGPGAMPMGGPGGAAPFGSPDTGSSVGVGSNSKFPLKDLDGALVFPRWVNYDTSNTRTPPWMNPLTQYLYPTHDKPIRRSGIRSLPPAYNVPNANFHTNPFPAAPPHPSPAAMMWANARWNLNPLKYHKHWYDHQVGAWYKDPKNPASHAPQDVDPNHPYHFLTPGHPENPMADVQQGTGPAPQWHPYSWTSHYPPALYSPYPHAHAPGGAPAFHTNVPVHPYPAYMHSGPLMGSQQQQV